MDLASQCFAKVGSQSFPTPRHVATVLKQVVTFLSQELLDSCAPFICVSHLPTFCMEQQCLWMMHACQINLSHSQPIPYPVPIYPTFKVVKDGCSQASLCHFMLACTPRASVDMINFAPPFDPFLCPVHPLPVSGRPCLL